MPLHIGIDVGGTNIKGVVLDGAGKLYCKASVSSGSGKEIAENAAALCNRLISESGQPIKNFKGIGVGCAGMIDSENGVVVFAANLKLEKFPLAKILGEKTGLTVKLTNDANAAALGEAKFGAGKNYKNSVLITLGTGVGAGIVIDGKLFEGNRSAGAEIGHMVIERGGDRCTCGRRGCFEAYASATALIKRTKWAMEENAGSQMWNSCTSDTADGKTAFDYAETDVAAREVVDWYIKRLACGLINVANIFRPEVIMLGGGVAKQGERLTVPLQSILDKELFGGTQYAPVKITVASLGSDAGAYGAAALTMGD